MKLIIQKGKLTPQGILLSHIKLVDNNWKYIKFVKHNQATLDYITGAEIDIDLEIEEKQDDREQSLFH